MLSLVIVNCVCGGYRVNQNEATKQIPTTRSVKCPVVWRGLESCACLQIPHTKQMTPLTEQNPNNSNAFLFLRYCLLFSILYINFRLKPGVKNMHDFFFQFFFALPLCTGCMNPPFTITLQYTATV